MNIQMDIHVDFATSRLEIEQKTIQFSIPFKNITYSVPEIPQLEEGDDPDCRWININENNAGTPEKQLILTNNQLIFTDDQSTVTVNCEDLRRIVEQFDTVFISLASSDSYVRRMYPYNYQSGVTVSTWKIQ